MLWWTLKELKSDDWRARQAAVEKLGDLHEARAIDPLVQTLKDKNSNVRKAAQDGLVRIGGSAVLPLVALFKSNDSDLRETAQKILVRIGSSSIPSLGTALLDSDLAVREAAAKALGQIGGGESLDRLLSALKLGDAGSKDAAAAALVRIGAQAVRPLLEILMGNKPRIRETAAAALVRIGAPALGPLIAALKENDVRETVLDALGKIEPKWASCEAARAAVPGLIEELRGNDKPARRSAAAVLGEIGDSRALEPLLQLLAEPSEQLQEAAVASLGRMGDPRCLPVLAQALATGKPKVRDAAAASLTRIGISLAEPLVVALKSSELAVREAAAGVLVQVGHSVVEPLAEALWLIEPGLAETESENPAGPQFVAALNAGTAPATVGEIRRKPSSTEARPTPVRDSKSAEVQFAFLGASSPAKPSRDIVALTREFCSADQAVRATAIRSLLHAAAMEEDPLLMSLRGDNQMMRRAAAHALANQSDPRARDVLRADLTDSSRQVVLDAAESLLKVGEVSLVSALLRVLRECDAIPNGGPGSSAHETERATRLLGYLIENRLAEVIEEDLAAITELQTKSEPKFVSTLSSAGPGLTRTTNEPERPMQAKLSELRIQAQRELNRRKVARR